MLLRFLENDEVNKVLHALHDGPRGGDFWAPNQAIFLLHFHHPF